MYDMIDFFIILAASILASFLKGNCSVLNLKVGYIPELTRGNLYIYSPKNKDIYSSAIILKLT